ncbi:MAG: hypothetical protein APR55_05060 [Methanolinea sp. SDB]|nr:MAG: hypothetical protein APR55_05060 [Methanolinea sp. SDB]
MYIFETNLTLHWKIHILYHMKPGEQHYSDREIIGRWAVFENNPTIESIMAGRGLSPSDGNGVIGYFYVDHEEGISFRIHALCRVEPGMLPRIVLDFEDHGEGCVLRFDEFGSYTLLSNDKAAQLSFLEEQRWFIYYESEQIRAIRNRADLDRFRAPGFFDDVYVFLSKEDPECVPEIVWVRLEEMAEDGSLFQGVLLNEPDADIGVHEGDTITVGFAEHQEGRYLVAKTGQA